MPLVDVTVNGRAYTIACDDGEEDHLRELAAHVDAKSREVLESVGQVGDARVLLMAALLIADERHEAVAVADVAARDAGEIAVMRAGFKEQTAKSENLAAEILESAAKRLEEIASQLVPA